MKIAVRKVGTLCEIYNDHYDQLYFENLWKEHFINLLNDDDEVTWFEHMPVDSHGFDQLLSDYDAIIGAWIMDNMITEEILSRHNSLKYISTISHGYSSFDKEACKKRNIIVTNTHFSNNSVAQHAFALLLEICNNIGKNNDYYKCGKWLATENPNNKLFTQQIELQDKTIGIIGLGSIGYIMAKMAAGFGMKVIAYSKHLKLGENYKFIKQVDLQTLLKESDIISIHCPSTEDSIGMINENTINQMKDGVILVNTARGDIIDEKALLVGLNKRKIYAAALDVLPNEPIKAPTELLLSPYIVATEHIAWATIEARIRSITVACENFFNWRNGKPTSVIS